MGLPKLDTPTYELVVPSTQQKIKYRPFLVKEQKLLLMAQESNQEENYVQTMTEIINACTFGSVDAKLTPIFDIEYIFLQLRSKSVGEKVELNLLCPDDEKTYVNKIVDLSKLEVQMVENHTNVIQLTDKIKMIMKYPLLQDMSGIRTDGMSQTMQSFAVMKYCVSEIHDGDTIFHRIDISDKDLEDFLESMDTKQLETLMQFFEHMPKVRHNVEVNYPKTKVKSEIVLEGMESFLK